MCKAPIKLANGCRVVCGQCVLCRADRLNDFVGRCLAEQHTSTRAVGVTLTYRGDVAGATLLNYYDVQRMLWHLRSDGYRVRYIFAGEHGELKGRAHWHGVLFFSGLVPELTMEQRVNWKYWPHGFIFPQEANYNGFRYLLKYLLKDDRQHLVKRVRLSKQPTLGSAFFQDMAERMVAGQIAMHNAEYAFGGIKEFDGRDRRYHPRKFWLRDASFRDFAKHYCDRWQAVHGCAPPDTDFLWEQYYDKLPNDSEVLSLEARERRAVALRPRPELSSRVSLGYLALPSPLGVVVCYDDWTIAVQREDEDPEPWHVEINASAETALRQLGLSRSLATEVVAWARRRNQGTSTRAA